MSLKSLKNQTLRNKSTVNSVNLTGGAAAGPVITSIIVTDSNYNNLDDTALLPAGGYAKLIGSGFASGCSAYFNGSAVTTTFVSSTEVRVVIPATTAGTYNVMLFNPSTAGAIYLNLGVSAAPTFTTSAGSLGTSYETTAVNTSIAATGDTPITYALYSGSLPDGVTLSSNGTLSGTSPVEASSTTYSFVVQATDAQLQDTTRSFSLTISTDVVTWSTPAADYAYTLTGNEAMSNVTLSATSAAGYNITYAANTLPTGVSLSGNTVYGTPTVEQTVYTALTATAATTGRSATRYVSWSVALGDAYWKYTTLLLQGASTTFIDDASTNNFAVTINGDTKPNSFNPYSPGYYSNYFDGTGDYLTTPANTAFAFGTGDFSVEMWVYPTVATTSTTNIGLFYIEETNGLVVGFLNGYIAMGRRMIAYDLTSNYIPPVNTWTHIAVTRSGLTAYIFANGVQVGTVTASPGGNSNYVCTTGLPTIAGNYGGGAGFGYFTGYISNLRVVKGTAVYTSAFTPSTTPLTTTSQSVTASNVSLLNCQSNIFIDNSTNAFAITKYGDTSIKSFQPFTPNSSYSTYGSGYFDGSGDSLSLSQQTALSFGTGDFTVEAWVYPTANPVSYWSIMDARGSATAVPWAAGLRLISGNLKLEFYTGTQIQGSITVPLNTWTHIAYTRSGTTFKGFVNGVVDINTTMSTNLNIAAGTQYIGAIVDPTYNTGYLTDVRIVKGTAVYTTAFTPPSQPLTAIANTSLLTLQNNQSVNNNVFLDNSSNNFLVTRNGNATQGTFSPYGGNWSNYFDGSGDYLSIANNAALNITTGNFTIECWIFCTALTSGNQNVINKDGVSGTSLSQYTIQVTSTGKIRGSVGDGNGTAAQQDITGATTISLNTWYHVAFVKNSTTLTLYLNGVSDASATQSVTMYSGTKPLLFGWQQGQPTAEYFNGYISNARLVKGTALYTSNFTSSTTPLTAITNTSLLTCQSNRLIDNSINNFAITKNGDVSVQRFSPFSPASLAPTSYSGYFNGTSNLSCSAGTGFTGTTFTIEGWVNISQYSPAYGGSSYAVVLTGSDNGTNGFEVWIGGTATAYNSMGFLARSSGTVTVNVSQSYNFSLNTWYHVAVVKNGTSYTFFVNGTSIGTSTAAGTWTDVSTLYVGYIPVTGYNEWMFGYISNLRISKGSALYSSNFTPSTTPLTAVSGTSLLTCQSTTFIDNSTNNYAISVVGSPQPSIQNPFGYTSATTNGYSVSTIGGSGYFDGTGDYLTLPVTSSMSFAGDFTIEFWVYLLTNLNTSPSYLLMTLSGPTYFAINMQAGSYISAFLNTSGAAINATDVFPTQNAWNHIALVRTGSTVKIYVNGKASATTATNSSTLGSSTVALNIANGGCPANYMSDFRVINGTALYTSNFVPPSAPLTAIQNTTLLTNMTSAGIYDAAMMNDMETVGDAKLSTAVSKFGGSSMYFDGTGDYLSSPTNPTFDFGTGDFTVECWVYLSTLNNPDYVPVFANSYLFYVGKTGEVLLFNGSSNVVSGTAGDVTINTWTHIAWVRNSGVVKIYVNGVQKASATVTASIGSGSPNKIANYSTVYLTGYIDDLRITKGYARYTTNFTAPTSAFQIK